MHLMCLYLSKKLVYMFVAVVSEYIMENVPASNLWTYY